MLTVLEELQKLKAEKLTKTRKGSTVKGHWREYADGSRVYIEEHDREAHTIRRKK